MKFNPNCILTDENTDQKLKTCLPWMEKYKGSLQSLVWTPTTKSVDRSRRNKNKKRVIIYNRVYIYTVTTLT